MTSVYKAESPLGEAVENVINNYGVKNFLTGMALGFICLPPRVLELKESNPQITLECVLPCENQNEKWTKKIARPNMT